MKARLLVASLIKRFVMGSVFTMMCLALSYQSLALELKRSDAVLKQGASQEIKVIQVREATLQTPKGKTLRFTSVNPELSSEKNKQRLKAIGVGQRANDKLCTDERTSRHEQMQTVELELELAVMIESLRDESKAALSTEQKRVLAKTPLCDRFIMDATVIERLVQGAKLVSIEDKQIQTVVKN